MERVTVIKGNQPILIVAPHGYDDKNTKEIAQFIAKELGCYCVTNNGWRRSNVVDAINGEANCNDVRHCLEDVVKDEFLDPILGFSNRTIKDFGFGYIFYIHGMGQNNPDMIIGYGEGDIPSYTCRPYMKDIFIKLCQDNSISACGAGTDSKYGGRAKNNLNQLFRRWYLKEKISTMQLEIASHLRATSMIKNVGIGLSCAIDELLTHDNFKSWSLDFTGI